MIPFTQYLRPDGRQHPIEIERPKDIEEMARRMLLYGWRFEVEELSTGDVSLTVHDPRAEEDVAIEVVPNGPGVLEAVDRLVQVAHDVLDEWDTK